MFTATSSKTTESWNSHIFCVSEAPPFTLECGRMGRPTGGNWIQFLGLLSSHSCGKWPYASKSNAGSSVMESAGHWSKIWQQQQTWTNGDRTKKNCSYWDSRFWDMVKTDKWNHHSDNMEMNIGLVESYHCLVTFKNWNQNISAAGSE